MEFWTTGRIDEQIEFEAFQPVMLEIRRKINASILDMDFGSSILSYDVIINIFLNRPEERFKYSAKTKDTDIDVSIDHDEFLYADHNKRCILYLNAILRSIQELRKNKKIGDFNFDLFYISVHSVLKDYDHAS